MTFPFRLISGTPKFDFMGKSWIAFILSITLTLGSIALLATKGLNLGIDFTGGIVVEIRTEQPLDIAKIRSTLTQADIGEVSLQSLGDDRNLMIRVGQSGEDMAAVVENIKQTLARTVGEVEYRKVDYVGPSVGRELLTGGALAIGLSFLAIMVYIWFRFEWQFGVGGLAALLHDGIMTLGLYSLLSLEFNLSSVAAILTIIGYSINDSVIIYDRIRENMRKYKKLDTGSLINISINETLSRTIMTVSTTLASLIALIWLGGDVIRSFCIAMLFGIVVGTYSSVYISAPVLIFMNLRKIGRPEKAA